MKRQGDNSQLTREQYDALEDDEAEAGVYKKASAEKMATRKIVKRGQKFANLGSQNTAPLNAAKPSSAFSSLASKPAPVAPKAGNVFGSIALTSGSNNAAPIGINKTPSSTNTAASRSTNAAATTNASAASAAATSNNNGAPQSKMQKLNKSFKSWVDKQMVNHSVSNWTAGLQDYVKHAKNIAETVTKEDETKADDGKTSSLGSFQTSNNTLHDTKATAVSTAKFGGFGQNTSKPVSDGGPKTSAFGGFSAAPASAPAASATVKKPDFGGFGTTTAPSKPAAFTGFGGPAKTTTPAATGGFTANGFTAGLSGAGSIVPPAATGFGTGATGGAAGGAGGAASGVGTGSEEYEGEPILEPEKIYKNEKDTDEILYEANCKAFRYDTTEKEWKESGKGSLRMTQEPGVDKKKILVRNTLGKITINAYIFKGMNIKQAGKSGLQFMAVVDASGVPQSFLVKVKQSEIQTALDKFMKAEQEAK